MAVAVRSTGPQRRREPAASQLDGPTPLWAAPNAEASAIFTLEPCRLEPCSLRSGLPTRKLVTVGGGPR